MPFNSTLDLQRVIIEIDPKTLEYKLEIHACELSHLHAVISDIKTKLEQQDLGDEVIVTEADTGKELDKEEQAEYFARLTETEDKDNN